MIDVMIDGVVGVVVVVGGGIGVVLAAGGGAEETPVQCEQDCGEREHGVKRAAAHRFRV